VEVLVKDQSPISFSVALTAWTTGHKSSSEFFLEFRTARVLFIRVLGNQYFCVVYLRLEMKSIATICMPEVVSDLPYDCKKVA
jgi:hypothetical protein